jgi:hypothetical protein
MADPQVFLTAPGLTIGKQSTSFSTSQARHIKDGSSQKVIDFSKSTHQGQSLFQVSTSTVAELFDPT